MAVTYATVTSVGAGPGPRLKYEFYPETTNNTVTVAADNYTHVGPYAAVTNAQGGFTIALPSNTDQGGGTLVWRVVETPLTQIPNRGLNARTIGYFTIPASIDYDDLIASAIAPTVVTPTIIDNVGNLAADAQNSADAAAASAASVNREQANGVAGLDASGKLYSTRIPDLAATYVSRSGRTQHAPALGLYFPEAEGAAANGTTDDTTAINAALTAAGAAGVGARVLLAPGKTYALGSQLTVPAGTTLEGRATLKMLAAATSRAVLVQDVSGVTISDITIDLNKAATTDGGSTTQQQGIYVNANGANVARIKIARVRVINGWQRGIMAFAGTGFSLTDLDIDGCQVDSCGHVGIYVSAVGNADKTTASTSQRIKVRGCSVTNPGSGGIQAVGVSHVVIANNTCDGAGTATGHGICLSSTGTAVQVTDCVVSGNTVAGFATSPRWGIVVSTNSTRFTIANNTVTGCAGGITVDPEDGAATGVRVNVAATIVGNVVKGTLTNHGINVRLSENVSITGNTSTGSAGGAGIAVTNALTVAVVGNTVTSNSTYGVAIFGTDAGTGGHTVGPNANRSNTSGALTATSPPVACTYNLGTLTATTTSDQSVTSSTTVVDSGLTIALEANAKYEIEGYLIYDGGTTGDIRTGFSFPAGDSHTWFATGPITTAGGLPATVSTSGINDAGQVALHGAAGTGSPVPVLVTGVVTTTTAGNLKHRFAQSVSDATATTLKAGSRLTARRIA